MPEPQLQEQEGEIDFHRYLEIFLRRRWVLCSVFLLTTLSAAVFMFTRTPSYQARALILIEKERGNSKMGEGVSVESTADDYYQTQYYLLKSDSLLQKVYDALHLSAVEEFNGPQGLAKLRRAITISPVLRSRLVHVAAESRSAPLATDIANTLAESFVRQNLENQLFISKEILEALEVDSGTPTGRRVQERLPAVVNNPLIQQFKADLAKMQAQYADLSRRYTEKHPALASVQSNITALEAEIRQETDRVVMSLKTELSGQLRGNNVRIVDKAMVPSTPFRPRVARNMSIGSILGLFLGIMASLLVENLDQTIRTQADVEKTLGQPFLGAIPFLQLPKDALPFQPLLDNAQSLTSESFRNLRTMSDFANMGDKDTAFLVTSTVQEEGKSYVMTNLAVSFAQLGERVLIIDGDLRRPKIHKNFRISTTRGLSNFLVSGSDVAELAELVQDTEVPNLKALPCGTRPPNPSELLNTPRLAAAVSWAKANFDRVLVDCTPMFPIHDTLLWGRHIKNTIFVTRFGKTRVPLIKTAIQRLNNSGVKVLGIAVNAAKTSGLSYSGYGYYYQQYYRTESDAVEV